MKTVFLAFFTLLDSYSDEAEIWRERCMTCRKVEPDGHNVQLFLPIDIVLSQIYQYWLLCGPICADMEKMLEVQ